MSHFFDMNGLMRRTGIRCRRLPKANRSTISRALVKAIANRDYGKPAKAAAWVAELARPLDAQSILSPEYQERREVRAKRAP
jgi:hypothetical protein